MGPVQRLGGIWKQDYGQDGKKAPKLGFKYKLIDGSVVSGQADGSTEIGGVDVRGKATGSVVKGEAGISAGWGEKGASLGIYGITGP